jgi:ElaB/YqjD/DUF883 family membrane-anchored ribosome-binding protein
VPWHDERVKLGTFWQLLGFVDATLMQRNRRMATRANVRRVVLDAQDKGLEAVDSVREVRDNMANAIDKSLAKRPYTTLALAVALGFVVGALWAR